MDTSNVHFRPVPVTAQAEMTSTYGHPRLNWPVMGRMNNCVDYLLPQQIEFGDSSPTKDGGS